MERRQTLPRRRRTRRQQDPGQKRAVPGKGNEARENKPSTDMAEGLSHSATTAMSSTCQAALGSHGDDPRSFRLESCAAVKPGPAGNSSGPRDPGSPRATGASETDVEPRKRGPIPKSFGGSWEGSRREQLQCQKRRSQAHEIFVARALGGRTTPGSGALGDPGDVDADLFRIECKESGARIFKLRLAQIEKIYAEAVRCGQTPAMAFRFGSLQADVEQDWIMLPIRVLAALLEERGDN